MNRTDSTSHTHPSWCDPRACDHDPLYPRHAGPLNGWKAAEDDVVVSLTLKRDDETAPAPNSERILGPVLVDLNLRCTALACTCGGPERDQEASAALTPDDCDRLARQLQAAAAKARASEPHTGAPGLTVHDARTHVAEHGEAAVILTSHPEIGMAGLVAERAGDSVCACGERHPLTTDVALTVPQLVALGIDALRRAETLGAPAGAPGVVTGSGEANASPDSATGRTAGVSRSWSASTAATTSTQTPARTWTGAVAVQSATTRRPAVVVTSDPAGPVAR